MVRAGCLPALERTAPKPPRELIAVPPAVLAQIDVSTCQASNLPTS
jgi:hypothetical protein